MLRGDEILVVGCEKGAEEGGIMARNVVNRNGVSIYGRVDVRIERG